MDKIDIYNKIAEIAKNSSAPVKISELAAKLGLKKDRGINSRVRGAYNHFKNSGDSHTAGQIRKTFTDENGDYPYMY